VGTTIGSEITAMTDIRDTTDRRTQPNASSGLRVQPDVAGHSVVLTVVGELDMATAPILVDHLRAAEAAVVPPAPFVLDLTQLGYLGSPGLSLLVEHHWRCAELGSPLRVVAPQRGVRRLIEITGLDELLTVVPTLREAVDIGTCPSSRG
jgi:anti-anti-sigma factor